LLAYQEFPIAIDGSWSPSEYRPGLARYSPGIHCSRSFGDAFVNAIVQANAKAKKASETIASLALVAIFNVLNIQFSWQVLLA
jgi:hypothetical protein